LKVSGNQSFRKQAEGTAGPAVLAPGVLDPVLEIRDNVFNHTNFNGVDTTARFNAAGQQTSTTFGRYSSAQFPRRLNLAFRISF